MSYNFIQNKSCEFFPCHTISKDKEECFNCLMCFCPLHHMEDCGGNYIILDNGVKDCSNCTIPHFNYDYVIKKLMEQQKIDFSKK